MGKTNPRNIIIAPTQYGKSLVVALAVLCCATIMREKWIVVAPSEKKAQIIMGYVNEHIMDNPWFYTQLDVKSAKEKLKRETSKKRVTFSRGGEVSILTLDSRNSKRNVEAAIGFGSPNIILDESSLVEDVLYTTVLRMLGGHKETFLLEIGNPFYRNHFWQTWEFNEKYHKVFIDYKQALAEGRLQKEFIEEMRDKPFFTQYYECEFPDEAMVDMDGFWKLLKVEDITYNQAHKDIAHKGDLHLGCDIAGGGDMNVFVLRSDSKAEVVSEHKSTDTMVNVGIIDEILKKYKNLNPDNVYIDDIGIGRGVTDRVKELYPRVNGVSVGERSKQDEYFNLKAEMSWSMREAVKKGLVVTHPKLREQLTWYKYKKSSDRTMQMERKEDLMKRTGKSPDYGDALMLTYYPRPTLRTAATKPSGL